MKNDKSKQLQNHIYKVIAGYLSYEIEKIELISWSIFIKLQKKNISGQIKILRKKQWKPKIIFKT